MGDALTDEYDVVVGAIGTSITQCIATSTHPAGVMLWAGIEDRSTAINAPYVLLSGQSVITSFFDTYVDFSSAMSNAPRSDTSWADIAPLCNRFESIVELMNSRSGFTEAALLS